MICRKKNLLTALALPVLLLVVGCGAKTIETTEIVEKTNVINNITVEETEGNTIISIEAAFPINYTAFKLTDPVRIVIDINESDAGDVESSIPVFNETVKDILVTQFDEDESNITRVEVVLNEIREYNIEKEQNKLYVTVNNIITEQPSQEEVVEAEELPEVDLPVPVVAEVAPAIMVEDVEIPANKAKYIADLAVNEIEGGASVIIKGDGYLGDYNSFTLENPSRIVVDIIGVKNLFRKNQVNATGVSLKKVRVGQHPGKVRLVLDLPAGQSEQHSITRSGKMLIVGLGTAMTDEVMAGYTPPMLEAEAAMEEEAAIEEEMPVESVAAVSAAEGRVTGINFRQLPETSRVIISSTSKVKYDLNEIGEGNVAIDLSGVEIPKGLQRSLDTSDFDSPVSLISAYQLKKGPENIVRVIVALNKEAAYDVKQEEGNVFLDFVREPETPSEIYAEIEDEAPQTMAEMSVDEATEKESGPAQIGDTMEIVGQDFKAGKKYSGRRVSLDYKDADLHNLLRLFGEIEGLNVIIDEDVKGKVTLRLNDVPSDQALDIVLKSKGLAMEKMGNIVRFAKKEQLQKEEDEVLARKKANKVLEDLYVVIIPVNYATASDLVTKVADIKSQRGKVTVDKRTNVIIMKDIRETVEEAQELVRKLDRATPQVLIEARIVEIDDNYAKDLGVQWGSGYTADAAHGNALGRSFPNSVNVGAGAGGGFALNAPNIGAAAGSGTGTAGAAGGTAGGVLDFTFGAIDNTLSLDLKLSALETKGVSKIISRPRIMTMDNVEAKITQGFSLPFETTSAEGTKTEFVDANLELKVTPQVTNDGSIVLKIKAAKNEPDFARTGSGGAPSINKKEAQTEVLIKDGDTTVIGGIFTQRESKTVSGVPFLSKLPLIGGLFRSTNTSNDKAELLIFITPRIVKDFI